VFLLGAGCGAAARNPGTGSGRKRSSRLFSCTALSVSLTHCWATSDRCSQTLSSSSQTSLISSASLFAKARPLSSGAGVIPAAADNSVTRLMASLLLFDTFHARHFRGAVCPVLAPCSVPVLGQQPAYPVTTAGRSICAII